MEGEKRRSHRQSLKYPARADFGDGSPPRNCLLSNVSVTGAMVLVESPNEFPDQFFLLLAPEHGAMRRCRVAWREDNHLGLEFLKVEVEKKALPMRLRRKA